MMTTPEIIAVRDKAIRLASTDVEQGTGRRDSAGLKVALSVPEWTRAQALMVGKAYRRAFKHAMLRSLPLKVPTPSR